VDPRLHHLQGKTELVRPAELLQLLREFHREKSALRARHVAGARLIGDYNFNNTYQYVINREDVHLAWLRDAIADLGGTPEEASEPVIEASGKNAAEAIFREDSTQAQAFVDRWRDRIEPIVNARHKTMLRLMLGEVLEHKRFFDQALAGRQDLLGRRADGMGTVGKVLPTRWVGGR
jgi:Mn-containing catalase